MLHMIINPTAGNGKAVRVGEEAAAFLAARDVAFTLAHTERPGHGVELARAAALAGAESVLAVGGDGTVLEVARGLHGTEAALGIVPAGTGNDVVKMLGIPGKPMEALSHLLAHPARALDAGRVNDSLFLNVCGTGFDVMVLDYTLAAKKYVQGMLPYLWGVLRTLFAYKPVRLRVAVDDGEARERELLLVAVGNGRFIGGGLEVTPEARPDDGFLDLITIEDMPKRKLPRQLIKLLTGKIQEIPGAAYQKCRKVAIDGEGIRLNVDGEIIPMARVELEILPHALKVHW